MKLSAVAAFGLLIGAGAYYFASLEPTPRSDAVAPATPREMAPADAVTPGTSGAVSASEPAPLLEDREAAVIDAMSDSLAPFPYVDALVGNGLAPSDAKRIVAEFARGIAKCLFDAARADYEARGYTREEFLRGAEMLWTTRSGGFDLKRLPLGVAPCVTNVSQQAGLHEAVGFEARQPPRPSSPMDVPTSVSAAELDATEAAIDRHIASRRGAGVTDSFVQCEARGCQIFLRGEGVKIFELEFDRFAEQHGFQHAALGGDGSLRTIWLQR